MVREDKQEHSRATNCGADFVRSIEQALLADISELVGGSQPADSQVDSQPAHSQMDLEPAHSQTDSQMGSQLSHSDSQPWQTAKSLLNPDDTKNLLVALSGGIDSTALLVALAKLREAHGWQLSACHVNHGLRGAESNLDQQFCEKLCRSLDVPLIVVPLQLGEAWQERQNNGEFSPAPENMLRELRYANLLLSAKERRIKLIVTGHTLDDQAETILFRLLRGTSPAGLIAMEGHRELIEEEGVYLIRPMLKLSKIDCWRFLAFQEMGARVDSSNFDERYARNFIRSKLVPLMNERFPGWQNRLERFRTILDDEEDLLDRLTDERLAGIAGRDENGFFLKLEGMKAVERPIKRRMISRLLKDHAVEPNFERIAGIMKMIDEGAGAVSLSLECEARIINGKLRWLNPEDEEDDEPVPFFNKQETAIRLPNPERRLCSNIITWLNRSLQIERWGADVGAIQFPPQQSLSIIADLSRTNEPLVLRRRRPGDTIQPLGMNEKVRLKKYLHTHKNYLKNTDAKRFNQNQRHAIVLADGNEVIWVPGIGISEKLRVHGTPTHRLTFVDLSSSEPVMA